MQRILYVLPLVCLVLLSACRQEPAGAPTIDVCFSPHGGCTEAVVRQIEAAKSSIFVQAYSFTSAPIAKALVAAHQRDVQVEMILDKSHLTGKYSEADFFVHMGVPTRIDEKHAIAHNKIMILDGQVVITGSFNFTKQAEQANAENLLVIHSPSLAAKYAANWRQHAEHSEPYGGRSASAPVLPEENGRADVPVDRDPAPVGYVASVSSAVFHRPGCRSVAKIAPKNLANYATRGEAIQAGKKPCSECQP